MAGFQRIQLPPIVPSAHQERVRKALVNLYVYLVKLENMEILATPASLDNTVASMMIQAHVKSVT